MDAQSDPSFESLSNRQVLQRVSAVSEELARRGLIKSLTSSPVGGYAEYLAARRFGTQPIEGQDEGFDFVRPDTGARVQVKARRHGPDHRKTHFGDFGLLEERRFDEFIGVVFAWDWSIEEAWQMSWETVWSLARVVQGKHRLYFKAARDAVPDGSVAELCLSDDD